MMKQSVLIRTIWSLWSKAKSDLQGKMDVHTRIMKKNYETVPNWWFFSILVVVFCLSLVAIEGFGKLLQLPWWGLLMACGMAFLFTLPVGVIQATTNTVLISPGKTSMVCLISNTN